jgi:hypothetical protein
LKEADHASNGVARGDHAGATLVSQGLRDLHHIAQHRLNKNHIQFQIISPGFLGIFAISLREVALFAPNRATRPLMVEAQDL